MSWLIRQGDGNSALWGAPVSVTTFGAGGVITHGNLGTRNAVGRTLEVLSGVNAGVYVVTVRGGPTSSTVVPAPTPGGGAGATIATHSWSPTKQAAVAVTTFVSGTRIYAAGANFVNIFGAPCQKNDRVLIAGLGQNQGAWWIDNVVDANTIDVRPLNGQPALTTGPRTTETVQVVCGSHELIATDEANGHPVFAALFGTVDATQGSGVVGDFFDYGPGASNYLMSWIFLTGIGMFRLHQTGATSSTISLPHWVMMNKQTGPQACVISSTGPTAGVSILQLGNTGGLDRYDARDSSAVIGFQIGLLDRYWSTDTYYKLRVKSYASLWRGITTGYQEHPPNSELVGSIFSGSQGLYSGLVESHVEWTTQFGIVWYGSPDTKNFLFSDSAALGTIQATVTIEGLLLSDAVTVPMIIASTGVVTLLNSREDYTTAMLFASGQGQVRYTWNPRFVERDATGQIGAPITGIVVRAWEVQESTGTETELTADGSPWTTDANGRINGGAGVDFLRDHTANGTYHQRIVVEGGNYRAQNFPITMRAKLDYDHPVDVQQTDFEGETNR